eukprot:gene34152-38601_t
MANPPQESDTLTLHVRHVPGGAFSARVPRLESGELLEVELPFGAFSLAGEADDTAPLVFVVGGTGFAPVKSILDDLMKRRADRPITLLWGARRAQDIYLPAAVARWQRQWPSLRFVAALSDEDATVDESLRAEYIRGRADEALARACPDLRGHALYCCGSPAMVAAVREAALRRDPEALQWMQLYVMGDRAIAEQLVRRARAAGYSALVLTVDAAVSGLRERDVRNGFRLPFRFTPSTLLDLALHPRWSLAMAMQGRSPSFVNLAEADDGATSPQLQAALLSRTMDRTLAWEHLAWLRRLWDGPLLVKGLLHPGDAALAVRHG